MHFRARQAGIKSCDVPYGGYRAVPMVLICLLGVLWAPFLLAQEPVAVPAPDADGQVEPVVEVVTVMLPDSRQMAMALATPGLRRQALLDLAAAARSLARARDELETDQRILAKQFLIDRAWLQSLVDRYGWVQPHSSVLDPAAWAVLEELTQHDIQDTTPVFPGHSTETALIYQVFQRAGERLAVANLPILLHELESNAIRTWEAFLQLTQSQGHTHKAWAPVESILVTNPQILWVDDAGQGDKPAVENVFEAMTQLALSTVKAYPPDGTRLAELRYAMLSDAAKLAASEDAHGVEQIHDSLYMVNLIDGLHDGHYFEFIQGLLAVTSRLLALPVVDGENNLLADWLVSELPALSTHFALDFATVDTRLNAALSTAYKVLQSITDAGQGGIDAMASRAALADAVAQLALLIPDMGYYFDTPVRAGIAEEINICISIAVATGDDGTSSMTRDQFNACMDTLLQLADEATRQPELAGDMNGPFTVDTLRRELSVTPWQRINFGIGYLHSRYSTDCAAPANALPNPLEWAVLATTMSWFAKQAPVYFQTPENELRLVKMRDTGEQLIRVMAEQTGCLAASGTAVNDPVSRGMAEYETALRELDAGIRTAEAEFRSRLLRPGADISLAQDATQKTAYRPEDLAIVPCDRQAVCEMSGSLSATRALIGLFPDQYLVAEQSGMGQIEICYRNMEWVQRRSELVRPDDENVANYFGRLGFDLVGRYVENGRSSDIFGFRFTSPEEYHYLFAKASDEVLDDSCPVEWVGSSIVTPLRENRRGIVPNRLTYLAASRKLPSRLLQNNWDRGAEWRDWFVTGIGVKTLEMPPAPEIVSRLNQHLQSLYQSEQADIYQRVLLPTVRNSEGEDVSLFDEMSKVSIFKSLIRTQMMLFYPESLFNSDAIRMAIAGDMGLLEGRTLRRFREDNVALTTVTEIARQRLEEFREAWAKQPQAVRRQGSVPTSLAQALTRINILYREFFTARPERLEDIDVTAPATAE